jgi:hypothetical protein
VSGSAAYPSKRDRRREDVLIIRFIFKVREQLPDKIHVALHAPSFPSPSSCRRSQAIMAAHL